jgi:hypothetical protein
VAFCYFILMPVALAAAQMYSNWLGFGALQWRAEDYISFVCKFMLGMGLGFELPVVLLTLVKIGVLSYATLAKAWRYMIVINLILGAVLTTPEVDHATDGRAALYALRNHRLDRMVLGPAGPDQGTSRAFDRLVLLLLAVGLVWAGYVYGWPLVRQHWHADLLKSTLQAGESA